MKEAILAFVLTISGQCENPQTIETFVDCNPEATEVYIPGLVEPCYGNICDGLEEAIVDPE